MLLDISFSLFVLLCLAESYESAVVRSVKREAVYHAGSHEEVYFKHDLNPRSESDVEELMLRASQSFERIKSISVEAHKAEQEMGELLKILAHTVKRFRIGEQDKGEKESSTEKADDPPTEKVTEDSQTDRKTDSPVDVTISKESELPAPTEKVTEDSQTDQNTDSPVDVTISRESELPAPTEKVTEDSQTDQKTDSPFDVTISKESEIPVPTEKVTENSQTDQKTDSPFDVTISKESEIPGPTEKVTEDSQTDQKTDSQVDVTTAKVTISQWPEVQPEKEVTQAGEDDQADDCIYNFPTEQIAGVPKSKCATWLLENYHKYRKGWASCASTYSPEVLNATSIAATCSQYNRLCELTQSNKDCCTKVVCQLHKETFFYPIYDKKDEKDEEEEVEEEEEGAGDLLKLSCMSRDHSYLDNSCVKWMFNLYHMIKPGQSWQKCSSFDYSRYSTKGCGKLKRKCQNFEARNDRRANQYCCASVYCYGRRRHFLRLA